MSTPPSPVHHGPGVIFDWDGVIVDSTDLHALSWQRMAESLGLSLPAGIRIGSLGVKTELVLTDLLQWSRDPDDVARLTREKEALFRRLARERGLQTQPGLRRVLEGLQARQIPCAIGSSAPRLNIETGLDLLHLRPYFRAVVSGDEVSEGKPAPGIFLEAARRIECLPAACIVFEDAPAGIAAARAAGMRVIALTTTNPASALSQADRRIRSFDDLGVPDPRTWLDPVAV